MFSIYTHELEDLVMGYLRKFMASQSVQVFSLVYDGMITSHCSEQLLRDAETFVEESCGLRIQLVEKPLHGLQDEPVPELACMY